MNVVVGIVGAAIGGAVVGIFGGGGRFLSGGFSGTFLSLIWVFDVFFRRTNSTIWILLVLVSPCWLFRSIYCIIQNNPRVIMIPSSNAPIDRVTAIQFLWRLKP